VRRRRDSWRSIEPAEIDEVEPPDFAGSPAAIREKPAVMTPTEVDIPEVKAEVEAAFAAYERALVTNDVAALDRFFLVRPTTIRYGVGENLYGYEEIAAFRAARSPVGLARTLERTVITTFGRDFAVAATLFRRPTMPGKVGRQMQTWVRTAGGWRVAAAHVSVIDEPPFP
jgi:hypothetical protein